MLYSQLSNSEKAIVQNTTNLIRSSAGDIGRLFNHLRAIYADTNATGLVASLDASETIPNTSGLAGADDLTREEVVDLYQLLNTIRMTNDTATNRAALSKAAGVNALLG